MSISKENKLLRLRKVGEEVELTLKQKISKEKVKIAEEHEVNLSNYDSMKEVLGSLGLKEFRKIIKHRVSFVLNDVHFEIDTLPKVPTFLEIEAPNLDKIKEFVKKLGFSMTDANPWSMKDVLKHYGKL